MIAKQYLYIGVIRTYAFINTVSYSIRSMGKNVM